MKTILIGLCALSLFAGLTPKTAAQTVTITLGPATDDSYWVWSDEYQCWVWNGPEFQGDYQGHPYSYWHGRHEGGGDRNHRPGKSEGDRPVNRGDVEQPKAEQPKAEVEKPKEQQPRTEAEKPKAEEKAKTEKPKEEEKSKTEKPKPGGGRVGLQQRQANRVFNQELEAQQLQHRPVVGYKYAHGDASLSFPPFCVSFVYGETVNADNRNESKR